MYLLVIIVINVMIIWDIVFLGWVNTSYNVHIRTVNAVI